MTGRAEPEGAKRWTSSILGIGGLSTGEQAATGEAPLTEPRLTAWDQAAVLLAVALALRLCAGAELPSVPGGPVV